jgi:hypothetical protein
MRRILYWLLAILILSAYPLALLLRSTMTDLQLQTPLKVVGVATPVRLLAVNPNGVREISASLIQGTQSFPLYRHSEPARRWIWRRAHETPRLIEFTAGKSKAPGLSDGKALLRVEAVSNDLRARADILTIDLVVNTKPPHLAVDEGQHYLNVGGAEMVTFNVSGYWTEAGVRIGHYEFRSFPIPGGTKNRRLCLFAYPYDVPEGAKPEIFARNPSGAEVTAGFWHKIFPRKYRIREMLLSDAFLKKVFEELDRGGKGDIVARFVKVNNDLRKANNQTLADLRLQTADRFLWTGPFRQLTNSSVEAQFFDVRRYFHNGQSIDQQVHFGFDLAVTARTPVEAANDGRVIWAAPLGIYGMTVVVDHGLALQSIYAHLSEILTKAGDEVKKGHFIGRSGATGMAAGDHLHFGMQVDGVPVNPIEWWDGHWLQDRILGKLGKPAK